MKRLTVGAIGARTTAFKTVRFDELALQRYGITAKHLIYRKSSCASRAKIRRQTPTKKAGPPQELHNLGRSAVRSRACMARLGVVIDNIVYRFQVGRPSGPCWLEIEKELKSPRARWSASSMTATFPRLPR